MKTVKRSDVMQPIEDQPMVGRTNYRPEDVTITYRDTNTIVGYTPDDCVAWIGGITDRSGHVSEETGRLLKFTHDMIEDMQHLMAAGSRHVRVMGTDGYEKGLRGEALISPEVHEIGPFLVRHAVYHGDISYLCVCYVNSKGHVVPTARGGRNMISAIELGALATSRNASKHHTSMPIMDAA